MAQQAKAVNDTRPSSTHALQRAGQLRLGVQIEIIPLIWMTIEASVALIAGYTAHSISLQGFGIDSIIELLTGSVLLWRLLVEQREGTFEVIERAERRAAWIAAFIIADSAFTFLTSSRPQSSWWGIGLAIAAAIAMPLLWQAKLRIARQIGSAALKADAMCSVTCAYMSLALLTGLLLNKFFGWWWADPLAALALVYFTVSEGREALHEARTGEACNCGGEECSYRKRLFTSAQYICERNESCLIDSHISLLSDLREHFFAFPGHDNDLFRLPAAPRSEAISL